MIHRSPSYVGESVVVLAFLNFAMWAVGVLPDWTKILIIPFIFVFVLDWMLGGIADNGLCKSCFFKFGKTRTTRYYNRL